MAVIHKVLLYSFLFIGVFGRPEGVSPHTLFDDRPGDLTSLLDPRSILELAARLVYPITNGVNGIVGRLVGPYNRNPSNYHYETDWPAPDDPTYYYPKTNNPDESDELSNFHSFPTPTSPENVGLNEIDMRFGEPTETSLENNDNGNDNIESDKDDGDKDETPSLSPIVEGQPSLDETPVDGEIRQRKSLAMGPSDIDNNPPSVYMPVSKSPGQGNYFVPISPVKPSKPNYPNNGGSNVPGTVWNSGYAPGNVNSLGNNPQPSWAVISNPSNINPGTSSGNPTYVPVYWMNNPGQPNGNPNTSGYYVVLANDGSGGNRPVGFVPGNSGSPVNFVPGNGGTGVNIPVSFVPVNSGSETKIPAGFAPVNNDGLGGKTPIFFVPATNRPGLNTPNGNPNTSGYYVVLANDGSGANRPMNFVPANDASENNMAYVPVYIGTEGNSPGSFVVNNEPRGNMPNYVPAYDATGTNTPIDFMPTNENLGGASPGISSTSYLKTNIANGDEDDANH